MSDPSGKAGESTTTFRRRSFPPVLLQRRTLRVVVTPDPSAKLRCFELDESTYTLGRGVKGPGDIADGRMSREHARIRTTDGTSSVEDLGGTNGTYVDGQCVTSPTPLRPGSVLSVGDTLLVVDEEPDPDRLPAASTADPASVIEVLGISYATIRLRSAISTVAVSPGSVLLLGATGTGKEVAARAIHRLSGRTGAWTPVNCAAIPGEIAEAEFFGYKRGAFTGAITDRDGFFADATGGTLFLDEVGDLPLPLQAKLLRALEDGSVQPLGGGPVRKLDIRAIAATHVDLDRGGFRRDLLARLGDWILHLPSLAERRADIPTLWDHFARLQFGDAKPPPVTPEFMEALLLHTWPMNIRELQKLARRLSALVPEGAPFDLPLLPQALQHLIRDRAKLDGAPSASGARAAASRAAEPIEDSAVEKAPEAEVPALEEDGTPNRAALEEALRDAQGNVRLVAERNNWHRTQVYRWIRRHGLDPDRFR